VQVMKSAPMTAAEIVSEYEWLRGNGMGPALACEALGKSVGALSRMMWRVGRPDLAREIDREEKNEVKR
jgi:hypothetical protein